MERHNEINTPADLSREIIRLAKLLKFTEPGKMQGYQNFTLNGTCYKVTVQVTEPE